MKSTMKDYITINEFCKSMKITRPTYYKWLKAGLPIHNIEGSIRLDIIEINKWIGENKQI